MTQFCNKKHYVEPKKKEKKEKMAWGRYNNKDNCKDKYIFFNQVFLVIFPIKNRLTFCIERLPALQFS